MHQLQLSPTSTSGKMQGHNVILLYILYAKPSNRIQTKTVSAILAIYGCAVGMGDASRGRYTGRLWETSSDLGGCHCSCCSVSVCILFHLLVSLMHQVYVSCCLSSPSTSFQRTSITKPYTVFAAPLRKGLVAKNIHEPWSSWLMMTYSRPEMRFPSQTFLHTSDTPPVFCTPTTMTASCPANITTVWKTSVQMTAFKPPCRENTGHMTLIRANLKTLKTTLNTLY